MTIATPLPIIVPLPSPSHPLTKGGSGASSLAANQALITSPCPLPSLLFLLANARSTAPRPQRHLPGSKP